MPRVPTQFADLLSKKGRRVLDGRVPSVTGVLKTGTRLIAADDWLDPTRSRALLGVLEAKLTRHLTLIDDPIPPATILGMTHNYSEELPKALRFRTISMASRRSTGVLAVERAGVQRLLSSDTFGRFAEVISGRKVKPRWGTQLLAYGPGDYVGPHNDHHPENADSRDGYTDIHLTFCTPGVARQSIVYAPLGHFSEEANVNTLGGVTAYRLPFWHYTTPLIARRGKHARRWVLLGTFLDQLPNASAK